MKPGLVYGNIIPVVGGFALAESAMRTAGISAGATGAAFNFWLLIATIVGISLVMASGCVFNNVIDRDIDRAMERTKNRAVVAGIISARAAVLYGIVLGALGFLTLAIFTNLLTVAIAAFGLFAYIVLYSLWGKRASIYGPVIGSIAGAVPPVVGYCAASDRLDAGAIILFAILVLWQIPHFYAISIYRLDDYANAAIPVLPVKKGIGATKVQILLYIVAFIVATMSLTIFGYTGIGYTVTALVLGLAWLALCIKGFFIPNNATSKPWARKMFFLSLIVMVGLFATLTIQSLRI